eukprot:CAMPEP_0113313200 /NCGR_PEP_ID=MMETSP0010_2-20120614/9717_1 /TAXON_ID=216773 ORGANISM="Corethron hystrix, Strain 308" /NCGR_SAMPLE_ID=MMETSP0010_2 /ASSEMBLY_ACC=CAM_ASM_000155 /LENGTH=511 /DNA_ID=CAMNT_0000169161 /DNA_START=51 /DNA_END=1583 /DNA_ORIENTATION=- /assembly_acc=CAM_ASM_000155
MTSILMKAVLPVILLCSQNVAGFIPVSSNILSYSTQHREVTTRHKTFFSNPSEISRTLLCAAKNEVNASVKTVCVVGGGFGGLYAALTLQKLNEGKKDTKGTDPSARIRVVLLDRSDRFVFLPLLYELATEQADVDEVAPTFHSLLTEAGNAIEFIRCQVSNIDLEGKVLSCSRIEESNAVEMIGEDFNLEYDALVIATGMEPTLPSPELCGSNGEHNILPFYRLEDSYKLLQKLKLLDLKYANDVSDGPDIVVVGAGYSGVELATNLKETLQKLGKKRSLNKRNVSVSLVHRGKTILPSATEHNRAVASSKLKECDLNVMTEATVTSIRNALEDQSATQTAKNKSTVTIQSADGKLSEVTADLILWTAGARPSNAILHSAGLPKDNRGRILTGPTLRVQGTDQVFAIGDAGRPSQKPPPSNAQSAMQQAQVVAWNVMASLENDDKLLKFRYLDLGEMMTLGASDGTVSSLGGLVQLEGPAANLFRRLVYAVRMPTNGQSARASVSAAISK